MNKCVLLAMGLTGLVMWGCQNKTKLSEEPKKPADMSQEISAAEAEMARLLGAVKNADSARAAKAPFQKLKSQLTELKGKTESAQKSGAAAEERIPTVSGHQRHYLYELLRISETPGLLEILGEHVVLSLDIETDGVASDKVRVYKIAGYDPELQQLVDSLGKSQGAVLDKKLFQKMFTDQWTPADDAALKQELRRQLAISRTSSAKKEKTRN